MLTRNPTRYEMVYPSQVAQRSFCSCSYESNVGKNCIIEKISNVRTGISTDDLKLEFSWPGTNELSKDDDKVPCTKDSRYLDDMEDYDSERWCRTDSCTNVKDIRINTTLYPVSARLHDSPEPGDGGIWNTHQERHAKRHKPAKERRYRPTCPPGGYSILSGGYLPAAIACRQNPRFNAKE